MEPLSSKIIDLVWMFVAGALAGYLFGYIQRELKSRKNAKTNKYTRANKSR